MSNYLSPKKAPNLPNQETLERVLVALHQPLSIAVVASLAVHGLLWAALPNLLPDQQKEPDTQRKVQVVQLSPAEQGQLPPLGINPLPTLLPTKPSPPVQSGTKLPNPTKLYNDSSLDSMPVFPLPPPNIPLPDFSNLFPKAKLPGTKKEPKSQAPTTDKEKNPPSPPVDPGTPKKDSGRTDSKTGELARPTTLSPEQIAALQKDAERSRQLQALYTFNDPQAKGSLSTILGDNINSFAASEKSAHSDIDVEPFYRNPQKVIDFFPKDACGFVSSGRNASFGALVKPDGTLAKAEVMLTSGYEGLDIAAIEYMPTLIENLVKQKKIDNDGKFKLIRFEFTFAPKSFCSSSTKPT